VRIGFAKRVRSPAEARETLVALARQARMQRQAGA